MLFQSARITLKQHRFEIGAGALAMILIGAAALWVNSRLLSSNVPAGCFDELNSTGEIVARCSGPLTEFFAIQEHAGNVFSGMAVLPLAVALLAGVTLVAREIEARTAQTAWALAASRRRWFGRQLWPILLVLGATVTFAATAAAVLEPNLPTYYMPIWRNHGLYGPLVVARALAALGAGLVLGAALGRTLPAFAIGAVLAVGLVLSSEAARGAWVTAQPRVILDPAAQNGFDVIIVERAWRAPDGRLLAEADARALAPQDESVDPHQWLVGEGYEILGLGITAETARGWLPLEIAGFGALGLALVLEAVRIVDRRRPT